MGVQTPRLTYLVAHPLKTTTPAFLRFSQVVLNTRSTPEIATRLEYQWTNNIGDANTIGTRPDNGLLSLGVSYRFGRGRSSSG